MGLPPAAKWDNTIDVVRLTGFKLLNQIKRNLNNACNFLETATSVRGRHFGHCLRSPKILAAPLLIANFSGMTELNRDKLIVRADI